jgi:membrane protein DedA with SNARE-associated domain
MGLTEYPYRRFLLFSAIGGAGWAIYTCVLAYWSSYFASRSAAAPSPVLAGLGAGALMAAIPASASRAR